MRHAATLAPPSLPAPSLPLPSSARKTETKLARVTEPRDIDLIIPTARRAVFDAEQSIEAMVRGNLEEALISAKLATGEGATSVLQLLDKLRLPRDDMMESFLQHLRPPDDSADPE